MDRFKLTSWNIEWADKLLTASESTNPTTLHNAERRLAAVAREIQLLDPDIMLVCEGPKGEERAAHFFDRVAPQYDLITRGDDSDYKTQGQQWIWFLTRKGLPATTSLLHIDQWRLVVSEASLGTHAAKWSVARPRFIETAGSLTLESEVPHSHYRHPQVLQVTLDGVAFEVIGAHLKSKFINLSTPAAIGQPGSFKSNPEFVAEAVEARVKLSSECTDLRYYINGRFKADRNAPIIVAGDFNDGPGKELIEEQFLLHDLIGNLQGDVFFARRFLNHALFDFSDEERWTVQFEDKLDPRRPREILLDHILFSQAFVGPNRPEAFRYRALQHGGTVEHDAHHAINAALPQKSVTSDHRPVSMLFAARPAT
jgi:hypothetical protein